MVEGEFTLVKQYLEEATKKTSVIVSFNYHLLHELQFMQAELATLQQDEAALKQYAPILEELGNRHGHKLFQAVAHRAWGTLLRLKGKFEKSESRLNQALQLFNEMGTRWQTGRTLCEIAELALAQSDKAKARDTFSQALAVFEEMKAVPDAERTRAALELL